MSLLQRPGIAIHRSACALAMGALLGTCAQAQAPVCAAADWPLWRDFKQHFVSTDGRVMSALTASRDSYSEAQAYAMFFALVADDAPAFDRLWRWSLHNLAGGDLARRLPAWHWGRADDGSWRVLDANSASDADLWFAYALLEAGRLWQRPDHQRDARLLLKTIVEQEVVALPGLGAMLLPGPYGFIQPDGSWRLNPSYLPIPLLRRFALEDPQGPWSEIAAGTARMIAATSTRGLAADWVGYRAVANTRPAFTADPVLGAQGSYDAIRVYLWAGMTAADDPLAKPLRRALAGMAKLVRADAGPPEKVDLRSGRGSGVSPYGFSAAMLPKLRQAGNAAAVAQQAGRARGQQAASMLPAQLIQSLPSYYDHALSLFGLGWIENRYQFLRNGQVQLQWQTPCISANTH